METCPAPTKPEIQPESWIYPPGAVVEVCPNDADCFPGRITAVAIYESGRLLYQVAWWEGKTRHEEWLGHLEIRAMPAVRPMRIGFVTDGPPAAS